LAKTWLISPRLWREKDVKSGEISQEFSKLLHHFSSRTPAHRCLRHRQKSLALLFSSADADNITCYTPEALRALKMPAAEVQLDSSCQTHLHKQDYIFLCFIGFCIFFAGTVVAWLAGICAVIYQIHSSKQEEEEEEEEKDAVT